jgi:hypothetical protein
VTGAQVDAPNTAAGWNPAVANVTLSACVLHIHHSRRRCVSVRMMIDGFR